MLKQFVIVVLLVIVRSIEKAYTLNIPKRFSLQNFGLYDNTSHVVIGTYLHQRQNIDALKMIENSRQIGLNLNLAFDGKTKYFKIFGEFQDYDSLMQTQPQVIATKINNHPIIQEERNPHIILDWKSNRVFDEDESVQMQTIGWIQRFLVGIPKISLKIPAHYLCKPIGGVPLFKHLNHTDYIIQMHGNQNPYLSYQSIFSQFLYLSESNGYSKDCPKNPSIRKLRQLFNPNTTVFNIEKTLHADRVGYLGEMQSEISQANKDNVFGGIVFFDDHPINLIESRV